MKMNMVRGRLVLRAVACNQGLDYNLWMKVGENQALHTQNDARAFIAIAPQGSDSLFVIVQQQAT